MMKAVRRRNPLWAKTGTDSATAVDVVADEKGGHGPAATTTPGQGHGRVSDLTLHPLDASRRSGHPPQNADIPPVTFPGGRNPYLNRPLPPPPSRNIGGVLNNPTPFSMPVRPSTSSGPGSNKTSGAKSSLDKRLSKDDIALTGAGKGLYPAPKAPWLLTPEPSPPRSRMPSPSSAMSPAMSPPAMLPTPQSSASGEIQIGMALGSPTQDSTPHSGSPRAGWLPQSQTSSARANPSPPPVQSSEPTVQRTKTQKRRLFGSLFGSRKHAEPPKAAENAEAKRSTSSATRTVSNETSTPTRSHTVAGRKTPKHKPIVIRSMTMSQADAVVPQPDVPVISAPIPSASTGGTGLLNIDIPDIRLERYSVMFSGVLNPNGTKSSLLERRQATLERLKTISDRIEHLEGQDKTKPRRATSPQPMKSPAFSLFPQTPNRQSGSIAATGAGMASQTSLAPPRGLSRSNTSPAYLPSPSRASFEPPPQASPEQSRKERKTVTIVSPRSMDERNRAAQVEKLREQQSRQAHQAQLHPETAALSTTTFHFHPNESSLILDSPQSATSSSSSSQDEAETPATTTTATTTHHRPALKPTLPEPQWEIITPPSSTTSTDPPSSTTTKNTTTTTATTTKTTTTTTTPRARRTPSASSASFTSRPSLDTTTSSNGGGSGPGTTAGTARVSVDEADAALKAAVEISIARQISISRQQRRLLRPFGQAAAGGGGGMGGMMSSGNGGRGRSATTGGVGGVGGRPGVVAEELTVGVIKGRVTPVMVGGGGAGDRRSERVVLDVVE